jgi:hypothetical protein
MRGVDLACLTDKYVLILGDLFRGNGRFFPPALLTIDTATNSNFSLPLPHKFIISTQLCPILVAVNENNVDVTSKVMAT